MGFFSLYLLDDKKRKEAGERIINLSESKLKKEDILVFILNEINGIYKLLVLLGITAIIILAASTFTKPIEKWWTSLQIEWQTTIFTTIFGIISAAAVSFLSVYIDRKFFRKK